MILWIKWLHLIAIVTMIVTVLSKDLLIFIHPQTSPHVFKKMKQVGMVALSLILPVRPPGGNGNDARRYLPGFSSP